LNRRRNFIRNAVGVTGGAIAGALAGCGGNVSAAGQSGPVYVFVHGAWHSGACWNNVQIALQEAGKNTLAVDLPGAGLKAKFPQSFITQDLAAFNTEPSPLVGIGLESYADTVVSVIQAVSAYHRVVLVGHSLGGLTITRVAERIPHLIERLVYLSAYCPVQLKTAGDYNELPEAAAGLSGALLLGDPAVTGALRINPRSADASYVEKARLAFYNDLSTADFLPFADTLMPDVPLQVGLDDAHGTPANWGTVPRLFIRCTLDQALPLALQDRMIREADQATPNNRFATATLASSHSAFASQPAQVAALLASL
jgi:pimeloyl-ACP methyl ester carboxylesterase